MSEYLQGSGRAARGSMGGIGWSYVFLPPHTNLNSPRDEEQDLFYQFLLEKQCRRRLIHREYNGKLVEHCQGPDQLCDLCLGRQEPLQRISTHAQQITLGGEDRTQLEKYVSFLLIMLVLFVL